MSLKKPKEAGAKKDGDAEEGKAKEDAEAELRQTIKRGLYSLKFLKE